MKNTSHQSDKICLYFFQLAIVGATIIGCFVAKSNKCAEADKQHIANMMTVITTSTFALYAAEK